MGLYAQFLFVKIPSENKKEGKRKLLPFHAYYTIFFIFFLHKKNQRVKMLGWMPWR